MDLPQEYVINKIFDYARRVVYKGGRGLYNFACPICNEGSSASKKRRGYYFLREDYFFCQNCQRHWNPVEWIKEAGGISYQEIVEESKNYANTFDEVIQRHTAEAVAIRKAVEPTLPADCINLSDPVQLEYYKDNKMVQECLAYISKRRLSTAVNRPKNFYISLVDELHKNRLCIPFYNEHGKIVYYQTRAIRETTEGAKYYCKKNADKPLYGIGNLDRSLEHIFLFEGPIDSMFCSNGLGMCGLTMTEYQRSQMESFRMHKKVWVIDNQMETKEVRTRYQELIETGDLIFCWPTELQQIEPRIKDFNDLCMVAERDCISTEYILKHSKAGVAAEEALFGKKDS